MTGTTCSHRADCQIGLVCTHIAHAIDGGRRVGFFWGDDTDTARPDAWCLACESALLALNGGDCTKWFEQADFKIICASCWDEAKAICGGFNSRAGI